jgi:hypothetical protein
VSTAVIDQLLAAVDEVERICGVNEHLLNDELIERIVKSVARGQHTFVHDIDTGGSPIEARPRIVNVKGLGARLLDTIEPVSSGVKVMTTCARCDLRLPAPELRRLWVPAGALIVEFELCSECADYLDRSFAPVVWRD